MGRSSIPKFENSFSRMICGADDETIVRCDCGSNEIVPYGPCRASVVNNEVDKHFLDAGRLTAGVLYRCCNCAMDFRCPSLSPQDATEVYCAMPITQWQYRSSPPAAWVRTWEKISGQAHGDILDVGAFDGQFLDGVPSTWRKFAIELNRDATEKLKGKNVSVLANTASQLDDIEQCFDVITMFDVFEHVEHPSSILMACISRLKPGGRFFWSTGNSHHWTWRLLLGNHPYLASYRHIRFANPDYVNRLCRTLLLPKPSIEKVSHRGDKWLKRFAEIVDCFYFALRGTNALPAKATLRFAHSMPYFRRLRNKDYLSQIKHLRDHMLVELRKPKV